jgi:hypothetical protein
MQADPPPYVTQNQDRSALEDIAHLTRRICLLWGTSELDTFLSRLLMDARDGDRQGLPMAVATDILFLAQINKMVRAMDLTKQLNINLKEAYNLVDTGDQARLGADALDDPLVSHDTITRTGRSVGVQARSSAATDAGSQVQGLGELLLMLVRSKWLAWGIVLVLGAKFVWPTVRAVM